MDKYVEQFLPAIGMAVDVGANDGTFFSNTLHLEDKGWTVLCVEPNPMLIKPGRSVRKLWRQVACGARDESGTFYARGPMEPWPSGSSVLASGENVSGWQYDFPVRILRLDRVLEEAGFHRLDFLTVDTELCEDQVMAGFTIERWKPTIMVLENIADAPREFPGYEKINRLEFDNVYRRNA